MPRRHWLDPLARRLLIATGQIQAPAATTAAARPAATALEASGHGAAGRGSRPDPAGGAAPGPTTAAAGEDAGEDAVERELLALKLRHNPGLRLGTAAEVRHAAALGWRLDVNRATAADWLRLPGCRPDQVDLLLRLQGNGVQISCLEDLQQLLPEAHDLLSLWQPLLDFRWYGQPAPTAPPSAAVAVNRADGAGLAALPGMTPERCQRLLLERRRAPFRDLADLQERLQLPPALIEQWIGRVSFLPPPSGPVLPPAARRSPR